MVMPDRQIGPRTKVNSQNYFSILFCKCIFNFFLVVSRIFISYKLTESTSSCSTLLKSLLDFGKLSVPAQARFWVQMLLGLYLSV